MLYWGSVPLRQELPIMYRPMWLLHHYGVPYDAAHQYIALGQHVDAPEVYLKWDVTISIVSEFNNRGPCIQVLGLGFTVHIRGMWKGFIIYWEHNILSHGQLALHAGERETADVSTEHLYDRKRWRAQHWTRFHETQGLPVWCDLNTLLPFFVPQPSTCKRMPKSVVRLNPSAFWEIFREHNKCHIKS